MARARSGGDQRDGALACESASGGWPAFERCCARTARRSVIARRRAGRRHRSHTSQEAGLSWLREVPPRARASVRVGESSGRRLRRNRRCALHSGAPTSVRRSRVKRPQRRSRKRCANCAGAARCAAPAPPVQERSCAGLPALHTNRRTRSPRALQHCNRAHTHHHTSKRCVQRDGVRLRSRGGRAPESRDALHRKHALGPRACAPARPACERQSEHTPQLVLSRARVRRGRAPRPGTTSRGVPVRLLTVRARTHPRPLRRRG